MNEPMMMVFGRWVLLFLLCASAACSSGRADVDGESSDVVSAQCGALPAGSGATALGPWLQSNAVSLDKLPEALDRIDQIVGEATLVGLGEPDHGFHEFPAFRNEVFKMLVERRGLRAITLESGFIEAKLVDQYVTDVENRSGITIKRALSEGITHRMGDFQETKDLVQWIRAYNERAAGSGQSMLRFGGKDLTILGDTLTVPLDAARPFLEKVGVFDNAKELFDLAAKSSEVMLHVADALKARGLGNIDPDYLDALSSVGYAQLTPDAGARLGADIEALVRTFDDNHQRFAALTNEDDFQWNRQLAVVAKQIYEDLENRIKAGVKYGPANGIPNAREFIHTVFTTLREPLPSFDYASRFVDTYSPEELVAYQEGRKSREQHLAENVSWLVTRNGKVLNFAATSHLNRAPSFEDGGFGVYEGNFLAQDFKEKYVLIGGAATEYDDTGLSTAPLRAEQAKRKGFEDRLAEVGTKMSGFVLDLHNSSCAQPDLVKAWLGDKQLTWVGPVKYQVIPAQSYDAIFWFNKATRAHASR